MDERATGHDNEGEHREPDLEKGAELINKLDAAATLEEKLVLLDQIRQSADAQALLEADFDWRDTLSQIVLDLPLAKRSESTPSIKKEAETDGPLSIDQLINELRSSSEQLPQAAGQYVTGLINGAAHIGAHDMEWVKGQGLSFMDAYVYGTPTIINFLEGGHEGFDLIPLISRLQAELHKELKNMGLSLINPSTGEEFDVKIHNALGNDLTEDPKRADTVSAVTSTGYQLGDEVLRKATVRRYISQ